MSPTDDTDLTDWHSFSYYINGLNEIEQKVRLRDFKVRKQYKHIYLYPTKVHKNRP